MNTVIHDLLLRHDSEWRFSSSVHETFTALYTIARHDKKLLEGEPLSKIVQLLFTVESKPGGPYYSTFPDGSVRPKIFDSETNESIARFLALYDIELPNLTEFLGKTFIAKGSTPRKKRTLTPDEKNILQDIRLAIKKRVRNFPLELQKRAIAVIERTITGNPDKQMSLMAYYTVQALGKKHTASVHTQIVEMGVANIFFWTAFIIYDDFWDEDEAADTRLLPIANLFARSYTEYFTSVLPEKTRFKAFFHELMDNLDGANAWETAHCRMRVQENVVTIPATLPVYGDYVHKYRAASGHILGTVALLCMEEYKIDSVEVKNCISYFEHYLIAMQLSDDMHDWEEDLVRGHISTAVVQLLKDFNKKNKKKEVHLENDIDELRQTFWYTTLPTLAKKALFHTEESRTALYSMKSIKNFAPLEQFILYPERAAKEALDSQKQSVEFLKNFI